MSYRYDDAEYAEPDCALCLDIGVVPDEAGFLHYCLMEPMCKAAVALRRGRTMLLRSVGVARQFNKKPRVALKLEWPVPKKKARP